MRTLPPLDRPDEAARDERREMRVGGGGSLRLEQGNDVVVRNSFPITAPRSRTARSPGPSRSRRAASSAWIVSGSARSASRPRAPARAAARGRAGFPPRPRRSGVRWSDSRIDPPRPSSSASASAAESASSSMRVDVLPALEERRLLLEQLLAGEADDENRLLARGRRHARRARGTSARPSGDRRRRGRAAASARAPRRAAGSATRSRPPEAVSRRQRGEDGVALVALARLLDSLAERPVRDPVAVGEAATPERRDALCTTRELGSEPRLADAGRSEDDCDLRHSPVVDRALERPAERRELAPPADERRVQTGARRRARRSLSSSQAEHPHRRAPALDRELAQRLELARHGRSDGRRPRRPRSRPWRPPAGASPRHRRPRQ